MKNVKIFFTIILLFTVILTGCMGGKGTTGTGKTNSAGLIGSISGQLGITEDQAMLGTTAVLILARTKMTPEEFNKVTSTMVGVNTLLTNTNNLSKLPTSIASMTELYATFNSLGLKSGLVDSIIPIVLTYAQISGGNNTYLPLQTALKK